METAVQTHDASGLTGRKFRIKAPFANPKTSKYPAFKQSAQWTYDPDRQAMVTAIGLGEITDKNFNGFEAAKLGAMPPLQSLFFDVDARRQPVRFLTQVQDAEIREAGFTTYAVSYGLAIPFQADGPSALPAGFSPLVVNLTKGSSKEASLWAAGMAVVFEGRITDAGGNGVFCSDYHGQVGVDEVTGRTRLAVEDEQCFITARIERVQVIRNGQLLAEWSKPPAKPY